LNRRRAIVVAAIAFLLLLIAAIIAVVQRPSRRRVPRSTPAAVAAKKAPAGEPLAGLPVAKWSERISDLQGRGEWDALAEELAALRSRKEYIALDLAYLEARALIESDQGEDAIALLEPIAAKEHPFRDLAIYHLASIAADDGEEERASLLRQRLIFEHPQSSYRGDAIDDEVRFLATAPPPARRSFAERLYKSAETRLRRDLDTLLLGADFDEKKTDAGISRAVQILRGSTSDDAADRAARFLDRPEIVARLQAEGLLLLGEAARDHRRYDRAVELLSVARSKNPEKKDDLTFAIGRAHFGAERFAEAEKTYAAAAGATADLPMKATFLWHAARSAQLQGNDARAEQLMTAAIAVKGNFPATSAALAQRMRTRLRQRKWTEGDADLQQIVRLFGNDHVRLEAAMAAAIAHFAAGRSSRAEQILAAIPGALADPYDRAEIRYWQGRVAEKSDPARAASAYLDVLRSSSPTHFAYFARKRLRLAPLKAAVDATVAAKRKIRDQAIAAREWDKAREAQTDIVLLASNHAEIEKLRSIYAEIPAYASVLKLEPASFPSLVDADVKENKGARLLALGLFDEAVDTIEARYPLGEMKPALTQALALNLAGASRESILAVEVMMKRVPNDFVPELLPRTVLQLLYPRYFYDAIRADAERYDADPTLVLSIMREESRFNPRAKSIAAARGLLQFIITTARDVARSVGILELEPEDLYDPRTIIQLGAKYIGDLLGQFGGNPYRAAAAYNAGPKQTTLWNRISPLPDDDAFLSSVNFEETKHYVRKVMNSHHRYSELYGAAEPTGGLRAEP
jgi:hypothetical protein